ncbi:hypothetical protein HMPREF9554_00908 [Treponema phagedenis F0421]|nr:hypothetical protein HMPREF9554_00908 [Treponema phagedenis F0421]
MFRASFSSSLWDSLFLCFEATLPVPTLRKSERARTAVVPSRNDVLKA